MQLIMEALNQLNEVKQPIDKIAARELALYIENDYKLYKQWITPINNNLARKKAKGIYKDDLAIKAYINVANDGAKKYIKDFGGDKTTFTPATREETAKQLKDFFEGEVDNLVNELSNKKKKNESLKEDRQITNVSMRDIERGLESVLNRYGFTDELYQHIISIDNNGYIKISFTNGITPRDYSIIEKALRNTFDIAYDDIFPGEDHVDSPNEDGEDLIASIGIIAIPDLNDSLEEAVYSATTYDEDDNQSNDYRYTVWWEGYIFEGDDENGINTFDTDRWDDAIRLYNAYGNVIHIKDNEYGISFDNGEWD